MTNKVLDRSLLSTPDLRRHMFKLLEVLEDTEMALIYHHHGKVFEMRVTPTHKTYKRKRRSKLKINPLTITQAKCDKCGGLLLADVCMNSECANSSPAVP